MKLSHRFAAMAVAVALASAGATAAAAPSSAVLRAVSATPAADSPATNPILGDGSYYSADPTALVVDDTLYVHAGRDEAGPAVNDFIMNEWQAFSTSDVQAGSWTHHPSLMRPEDVFAWATPGRAYAGQVVEGGDGRFYWYVPVHDAGSTAADQFGIGVAVSDSPLGPWTDHAGGPVVSQQILGNTIHNIDPTVFVDHDGRVYMYWGSFGELRVTELAADMKTLVGQVASVSTLTGFFEAPWLFERNGTYYLAYAGNNAGPTSQCTPANYHACIAYGTAPSPTGPWTYQGTVLSPVSSTTSHPAIVEFKGQWYMAYHTADAVGGNHFRRSVAIDVLEWDDSVIPARMKPVVQTPAKGADRTPRANVAPWATVTVSNSPVPTQYWTKALNDEIIRPNPLPPDMWGSWTGTRPSQQWLQYTWRVPVRVSSAEIKFWRDGAPGSGNGVSDPAAWVLQYWDGSSWLDVANPSGYPTSTTKVHTVTFDAVSTTQLRAVLSASPGGASEFSALAVEEWTVNAEQPTGVRPVAVTTTVGELPDLPQLVVLDYPGLAQGAPVVWDAVHPTAVAAPGTFTVDGYVEGYAAGPVTATVTIVDPVPPTGPDTTAPVLDLAASGPQGRAGWFIAPVTVRVSAADDSGGRSRIETRSDAGAWVSEQGVRFSDVVVTGDGVHTVSARATDAAGNVSAVATRTVRIDSSAPTATATVDAKARTVTLTGSDVGSGLALLEVSLDSPTAWQAYTGPVTVDDAKHVVFYRATDAAGNVSPAAAVTVPLSATAPLVGNIAPMATATASYTSGWNEVKAINDESDTGASWGTWPQVGQQWIQLTWDRTVRVDAAEIAFFADQPDSAAGGMIPPRTWTVQYLDGAGTWTGVDATEYTRDRDVFNAVTFPVVETTALRVVMQAWGAAEGEGSVGVLEWRVFAAAAVVPPDVTGPGLQLEAGPEMPSTGWFRGPVTVAVTATDDVDPAPTTQWRLDSGDWVDYLAPVVITAEGSHSLEVRSTDATGNVTTDTLSVAIDSRAPITTATTTPDDGHGTTLDPVTVLFAAADTHAGVDRTEYRLTATPGDPGDAPSEGLQAQVTREGLAVDEWTVVPAGGLVLASTGTWTVLYRSWDAAGNVEVTRSVRVTIDQAVDQAGPTTPTAPSVPTLPGLPTPAPTPAPTQPPSGGPGAGTAPGAGPQEVAGDGSLAVTGSPALALVLLAAGLVLAGSAVVRLRRRA